MVKALVIVVMVVVMMPSVLGWDPPTTILRAGANNKRYPCKGLEIKVYVFFTC